MVPLTESEKGELIRLLSAGQPLPEQWRSRLFPSGHRVQETGKEYRLVYDGKLKRKEVLAQTPASSWQLVREFRAKRPHADGWRNLLVWGDNLLALRELLSVRLAGAESLRHTRQDQAHLHRLALCDAAGLHEG